MYSLCSHKYLNYSDCCSSNHMVTYSRTKINILIETMVTNFQSKLGIVLKVCKNSTKCNIN